MNEYRRFADIAQRQHEASDANAVGLARDFIKFGHWLNAGGLAAVPIVAGIVRLEGQPAVGIMMWPVVCFALGLVFAAASTAFAFLAVSAKTDRSLEASELGIRQAILYERLSNPPPPDPVWKSDLEAAIERHKAGMDSDHRRFRRYYTLAFAASSLAVILFAAGVCIGARSLLG
jgi:hypothetical protein